LDLQRQLTTENRQPLRNPQPALRPGQLHAPVRRPPEHGLGDAFTADVRRAWTAAYNLLAATMKDAAATPEPCTVH